MINVNKELPEGLVEELEDALTGVFGHSHAIARLALSVIAPHYEKQIAELKAQIPQWLPISEAPKNGRNILGLTPYGVEVVRWCEWNGGEYSPQDGWIGVEQDSGCLPKDFHRKNDQQQPTHFMHLPKTPAE